MRPTGRKKSEDEMKRRSLGFKSCLKIDKQHFGKVGQDCSRPGWGSLRSRLGRFRATCTAAVLGRLGVHRGEDQGRNSE